MVEVHFDLAQSTKCDLEFDYCIDIKLYSSNEIISIENYKLEEVPAAFKLDERSSLKASIAETRINDESGLRLLINKIDEGIISSLNISSTLYKFEENFEFS